jgi:hypothetical protein
MLRPLTHRPNGVSRTSVPEGLRIKRLLEHDPRLEVAAGRGQTYTSGGKAFADHGLKCIDIGR